MSFRAKVLASVVVCIAALTAVTGFIVDQRIKKQFQIAAQDELTETQNALRYFQKDRKQNFLLRFQNLPTEPRWRSLFQKMYEITDAKDDTEALETLRGDLKSIIAEQGVQGVFYTSSSQGLLRSEVRSSDVSVAEFQTAIQPSVQKAFSGETASTMDTILVDDQLFDVISVPVYSSAGNLIGALTLASSLGNSVLQDIRNVTHSEIAFTANGQIIASTLHNLETDTRISKILMAASEPEIKPVVINQDHYYAVARQFQSLRNDPDLGYILLSSYEKPLQELQKTREVLLGVSLAAILFGVVTIWLLVTKVTKPLQELRDSVEAVGQGDFSQRVPVRSQDECGELATVFNQMTENLQQSHAELEQTVQRLKNTQAQLIQSEKLSAVGEFVAGVAHELNNPLAAVMGFSEILKNSDINPQHHRHLDIIYKSSQRCQKIVQSLLSFARREKAERKPVSLNSLIEAVLEMIQYQLRTGNIDISTKLDLSLPVILADAHQVQQVLLNIINNARQAIETCATQGTIKIVTEAVGQHVRVLIHDNGPGIPEENLKRIFDPFFTTKEVGQGTGLGLSLCYGIIHEHGGTITPLNRLSGGATFILEFPALQLPGDTTEMFRQLENKSANAGEGAGKKILVIDDEPSILDMIREGLSQQGYAVDVAANGTEALAQFDENDYDVALCDWRMPGLNGRQVYEKLRAQNSEVCRRFVFITGDVVNNQMRVFLEAEQLPCLAKPFTLAELHKMIQKLDA